MSYKRMMARRAKREQQNQLNAQKSTGPVTPEGKEISSRNAITHGLTSKKLTLNPEEREQFNKLLASYAKIYKPATEAEKSQLNYMVEHSWRLDRALKIEQILFDRTATEIVEENPDLTYDEALAVMFIDPRYTKRLNLFMRYKGQIDRAYRKALAELEKLIAARLKEEPTLSEISNLPANGFVSSFSPQVPKNSPEAVAPAPEPGLIAES